MAWTTPVAGIAGTIITAAWSTANVVNPLNWLRQLTGNADPPGSDYVVVSTSATATTWKKVPTDALADLAVTPAKMAAGAAVANIGYTPVNDAGDVLTGSLQFDNNVGIVLEEVSGFARTAFKMSTGDVIQLGNVNTNMNLLGGLLLNGDPFPAVPSGAVVWFETLAELTAAGSEWSRYTAADGRLLIGAGTTFGQTFSTTSPGPNYGTTWAVAMPAHTHNLGADPGVNLEHGGSETVTIGTTTAEVTGGAGSTTFLPPSRAGIWGRKS